MKQSSKQLFGVATVFFITVIAWSFTSSSNNQLHSPIKSVRNLISYQTNPIRTKTVENYCAQNVDRAGIVSSNDILKASSFKRSLNNSLGINGNTALSKIVNGNFLDLIDDVKANMFAFIIFLGIFLVGFLIYLIIWPFLCCCCCCPGCCPSKCCQQDQNKRYTKCELYWPGVALTLALLIAIGSSAYGITQNGNFSAKFQDMACSISIFSDDILNGNATNDKSSFFVGLTPLAQQVGYIGGNATAINSQMVNLTTGSGSSINSAITNSNSVLNDIKIISASDGSQLSLSYNIPIQSMSSTDTVKSDFVSILGTYNTSGIIYSLYQSVQSFQTILTTIRSSADSFQGQAGSLNSQVTSVADTINQIATNLESLDNQLSGKLSYLNYPKDYANLIVYILYGSIIGLGILSFLGVILTLCCDNPSCRHLIYFNCCFLALIAFVGLALSLAFSIVTPILTWTCDYLDYALTDQAKLQENFSFLLGNDTISKVGTCIVGDGDIIGTVGGTATNGLQNLTNAFKNINSFNMSSYSANFTTIMSSMILNINSFALSRQIDTSDSSILSSLTKIANYSNYPTCTATGFNSDSFVPSTSQSPTYISCNGFSAGTCSSGISSRTSPCLGCIDISQALGTYTSSATLLNDLNTRYPGCSSGFNTELKNIWTNYFQLKATALGTPINSVTPATGVLPRAKTAEININNLVLSVSVPLTNIMNNVTTNLNSISTLIDANYGVLAGLNCSLFGQDFKRIKDVVCSSFYNSVYLNRLTIGIASMAILFAMCCTVCTGVRQYKHAEFLKKTGDSYQYQQRRPPRNSVKNSFDQSHYKLQSSRRRF